MLSDLNIVTVIFVCSRNTLALPASTRYLFDELQPYLGVFEGFGVCAREMLYKLVLLSRPVLQLNFGRGNALSWSHPCLVLSLLISAVTALPSDDLLHADIGTATE